jgi:autotransporter-associated beta strand protein
VKTKFNQFLALASLSTAFAASSALAATYQWNGSVSSAWSVTGNWNATGVPSGVTAGPAATGVTAAHRLNVNNAAKNAAEYTSNEGTTTYGSSTVRGLVIGSGTSGSGTLNITGGTFSSLNATGTQVDIIGNGDGNTGTLNISGGTFIGAAAGTSLNIGGSNVSGRVSNLSISGTGKATLTSLILNGVTINVNLDGGTMELNGITNTAVALAGKIRLNSGVLKARQNNAAFIAANANLETLVQSGGAVIDTNGFDIAIAEPLLEDPASTGGGITKNSAGLLTLKEPSTTTGAAAVNAGGLGVKAGAASWSPSSFSHSGDKLNIDLGVYDPSNPAVINTGALNVGSAVTLAVTGSNFQVGQVPLIQYTSKSITGSLTLDTASLPPGVEATLVDNGTDRIYLDVTQAASIFNWSGASATAGTGDWDTSSLNWNNFSAAYSTAASQIANFPDIAGGGTVSITGSFSPLLVNISNASGNPYMFDGAGKLTGTTAINKSGTGRVTFTGGAHDYSGNTTITAGALVKQAADETTGNIVVTTNGVSFALDGTLGDVSDGAGQTLSISGAGVSTTGYFATAATSQAYRGALQSVVGANSWNGNILLASTAVGNTTINRIGVQNGADLTLTGNISDGVAGASVLFRGGIAGDTITLAGSGTYSYTGETQIYSDGGSIVLGNDNKLPTGKLVNLTYGGATVVDLNGFNQEVAGIYGGAYGTGATITNHGSRPSVLTVAPAAATSNSSNAFISDGSDSVSIVKKGAGTQILGYANTYSGSTTIHEGTLLINGDQSSASGAVDVIGGTLGGTGTLGGNVTVAAAGTLNPGVTLGTLTVSSADLSAGGTLVVDINDAVAAKCDKLAVTNDLNVTGTKLTLNVTGTPAEAAYVIATASAITGTIAAADVTGLPSGYVLVQNGTEIRLEPVPASDYDTWKSANGVNGGDNDDDDSDGLTNREEYAFGLNPTAGSPVNPIAVALDKTNGTFSYTRRLQSLTGLTYSVWYSTDLAGWTQDTGAAQGTPVVAGEVETVPVTVSSALLANPKLFIRVKAD